MHVTAWDYGSKSFIFIVISDCSLLILITVYNLIKVLQNQ